VAVFGSVSSGVEEPGRPTPGLLGGEKRCPRPRAGGRRDSATVRDV